MRSQRWKWAGKSNYTEYGNDKSGSKSGSDLR